MHIAISNIAWRQEENDSVLAALASLGIRFLELAPTLVFSDLASAGEAEAKGQAAQLQGQGFQAVAFQALLFGRPELKVFDPETHAPLLALLDRVSALAGWMGAGPLVFGSPKNRQRGDLPFETALARAAGFFREAAAICARNGATLCIEPNAPDYGCDFVTNTAEAAALVQAVDHPGFGLHLDAGVMTMNGENHEAAIELAMPYLRHFHASEPFLARLTERKTDHQRLGQALRAAGYQGIVSIEMRSDPTGDNVAPVAECVRLTLEAYSG